MLSKFTGPAAFTCLLLLLASPLRASLSSVTESYQVSMPTELEKTLDEDAALFAAYYKDEVKCVDTNTYFIYDKRTGAYTDINTTSRLLSLVRACPGLEHYESKPKKNQLLAHIPHYAEDLQFLAKTDTENIGFLNFKSGVLDMKTGELLPHAAKYCFIKTIPYNHVPQEEISQAKERILYSFELGEAETKELIKKLGRGAAGYIDREFVILVGTSGSNGKGVLMRACQKALGPFAAEVNSRAFIVRAGNGDPSRARPELKNLPHTRLIFMSEPAPGQCVDSSVMKGITGGDAINIRGLFKSGRDILVQGKIFIACNDVPKLQPLDISTTERARVFELDITFKDPADFVEGEPNHRRKDPTVEEYIKTKPFASAFVHVLLDGMELYQQEGYKSLPSLDKAREWVTQHDPFQKILERYVITGSDCDMVSAADLKEALPANSSVSDKKLANYLSRLQGVTHAGKIGTRQTVHYKGIKKRLYEDMMASDAA